MFKAWNTEVCLISDQVGVKEYKRTPLQSQLTCTENQHKFKFTVQYAPSMTWIVIMRTPKSTNHHLNPLSKCSFMRVCDRNRYPDIFCYQSQNFWFGVLRSLWKWLASRVKVPYGQREQVRPGSACAVRPVFPFRVSMNVDDRHEDWFE